MPTGSAEEKKSKPASGMAWWEPRFWIGADFFGWLRLLVHNRFAVSPSRVHVALATTVYSVGHTALRWLQELIYGRTIDAVEIKQQPLFILGHWRCGTTLLHELFMLDDDNTYPTTWECFSPNHFLLTERYGSRLLWFLLPEQRPMDNMAVGWDRPQEDEFALCNLGVPSPYLTIAFPNNPPQYPEYLDLENLAPSELTRWKTAFLRLLKQIYYRNPKRIVLKSPPHTARLKVLLEIFPDARFVYIARDPYVVYPSTIHLWKQLYSGHGLQAPTFEGLEEYVLKTFNRMHFKYEETKSLVPPENLYEVRYEDLVRDPVGQMQAVYERLRLGDFEKVRARVEKYFAEQKDYQTNRYSLDPKIRDEITRRWSDYIQKHGYAKEPAAV